MEANNREAKHKIRYLISTPLTHIMVGKCLPSNRYLICDSITLTVQPPKAHKAMKHLALENFMCSTF